MNSRLTIKRLEQSLENIRSITRVFEHTAARKMDVNRGEIDKLAKYIQEAQESYSTVKIASTLKSKNRELALSAPLRAPKKRKILILVSSESKYFGNLINSLVKLFSDEFKQGNADGVVIGEVGKKLLEKEGFKAPNVTYFDFDDDKPNWEVVSRVNAQLPDYLEVVIFYGQYKSILTQEIKREDIAKKVVVTSVPEAKKYDFEPKGNSALALLEKQIISSNFLQKLYETGLTKNAVAVKILEIGAIAERINAAMIGLAKFKLRLNKDNNNRKQTQLFSSRAVWARGGIFPVGGE
ncbi:MAG: F0F1 ATP synthase subunit gamma [Patescibacteria group bacterium]